MAQEQRALDAAWAHMPTCKRPYRCVKTWTWWLRWEEDEVSMSVQVKEETEAMCMCQEESVGDDLNMEVWIRLRSWRTPHSWAPPSFAPATPPGGACGRRPHAVCHHSSLYVGITANSEAAGWRHAATGTWPHGGGGPRNVRPRFERRVR